MNISDLLPTNVKDFAQSIITKLEALLQGETLRAIGYGAGVVIYFVAKAVGSIPDVSFTDAVTQALAAAAIVISVVETARHYVFSPATVAAIVTAPPPASAGPIDAAVAAGVDAGTIDKAATS